MLSGKYHLPIINKEKCSLPILIVIDSSVLIAFGEILTFVGSLVGIDYHYKYRQ